MQERVRICDIAEELGLSTATVSNVIHGKTNKVSDETVQRVTALLEKRQYIPSMAGILLAQNSSGIIGVFVNDHPKYAGHTLRDGFIAASLDALSTEIEAGGQFMMVKKAQCAGEVVRFASMWNMDGIVMIGQLGETCVAGVGLAGKFASMYSVVIAAVGAAAGIMISQYLGQKNSAEVRRSFFRNLLLGLGVAALFTAVCALFPGPVMRIYTKDDRTQQAAAEYLTLISGTFLPKAGSTLLSIAFRCAEKPGLPLYAGIVSAVLNTGLNELLIFGRLGLPAMGAAGAAIATVIAQCVNFLLLLLASKQLAFLRAKEVPHKAERRHSPQQRADSLCHGYRYARHMGLRRPAGPSGRVCLETAHRVRLSAPVAGGMRPLRNLHGGLPPQTLDETAGRVIHAGFIAAENGRS